MPTMNRRRFTLGLAALAQSPPLRVAPFRADVTPAAGEPLIWVDPAVKTLDPLWAKGILLDGPGGRVVLCALDWCGLGGYAHTMLRNALARAAGTQPSRVALLTVHQHAAPYIEGGGYELLARLPTPPLLMSREFLATIAGRLSQSASRAVENLVSFDTISLGSANVDRIASARRIFVDGKLVTRFSSAAKDPALAALPEGDIDPRLRTVSLLQSGRPLVRLHYYACHPQTFCCNGEVSADFVGAAREAVEKSEGVPQIYFTGCAGDITAGKYNDGSPEARQSLAARLESGIRAAIAASQPAPASLSWRTTPLGLPGPPDPLPAWPPPSASLLSEQDLYRRAIRAAFAIRRTPLSASCLRLGPCSMIHLPGEPLLAFQRHAPNAIIAGYEDISPGYICPDSAFAEGGYEPSAANTGPGAEAVVKHAIDTLLAG